MEKKNLILGVCTFVCGLVIVCVSVFLMIKPETDSTENEATTCEVDYEQVYGIDVSHWQGYIRWDLLSLPCEENGRVTGRIPAPRQQRPVQFAIIRATKSIDIVDSLYQRNYLEAKRQGIPCGAYHFLTDTVSGKEQAELFLANARIESGDLPPVLDIEIDSKESIIRAKEWLEVVEGRCRVPAIIYTTMNIYEYRIKNDSVLNAHDLWLAKPGDEKPMVPNCRFWQFTHEGHVCGIIDNVVDIDMFNGTPEEFQEYLLRVES